MSEPRSANLQHHYGQQRILGVLNLEDTPYEASCAFAIERSRGACSRRVYLLYSHSTPPCATTVESVHPDSRHHALRDRCSRSIGVISLFAGLSDACLHHSVGGRGHLFRSRHPDRQVRVGAPLRWRSGSIYAVPSDSVVRCAHLHTQHGDSGAVCGFADNLWKICWSVGT
jgi:hypothetical protein